MTKTTTGYAVAAIIGAILGILTGYFVRTASGDDFSFSFWLLYDPLRFGVFQWAIGGAVVGLGLRFLTVNR